MAEKLKITLVKSPNWRYPEAESNGCSSWFKQDWQDS